MANAQSAVTEADVGQMIRVEFRYGREAGLTRGKLLGVDAKRGIAAIEPLPRNPQLRTAHVPIEMVHLDVKANAITAANHVHPAPAAKSLPTPFRVDHPAAIANRQTEAVAVIVGTVVEPRPETVVARPVALSQSPAVPRLGLTETLGRLNALLAQSAGYDERLADAESALASAEAALEAAKLARDEAEDRVIAVMSEGEQVQAAARAVYGTLGTVIGA